MIRVELPHFGKFDAWRQAARQLASAGVPASEVLWADEETASDLFGASPLPPAGERVIRVGKNFLDLAKSVSYHSDPKRFSVIYAALLRLQQDRSFLGNPIDGMTANLMRYQKAIRRDIHKMHAFVRFHELAQQGEIRQFASWFEPEHNILEAAAPFFAKRFTDMHWFIATPQGVARFDGRLRYDRLTQRPDIPQDASHDLWLTYFTHIFNPARVKVKAMQSEMPRKYWKNLPEAQLIPQMLSEVPERLRKMAEAGASTPPKRAAKISKRLRD